MGIPDHLTCLLRKLYADQEATVRSGNGTRNWLKIRKGYILSVCLFDLYVEHIMRIDGLEDSQAGIKIARGNMNSLIYADETILMAWQTDGRKVETVTHFIFLGSKITVDSDRSQEIKMLAPWKKSCDKHRQHVKKQGQHFADKGQSCDFSSSHVQR